jgi:hypothetical protein
LWGERGDCAGVEMPPGQEEAPTVPPPRGRSRTRARKTAEHPGPPLHPGSLPVAELQAILGEVSRDGLIASMGDKSSLLLWLPSRGGVPLPSTAAADAEAGTAATLISVIVPTLAFSPADAVDLLSDLPGASGASCGESLRYWSHLAKLLLSLLSRQHFVPDVEESSDGKFIAGWRLLVEDAAELAWLERFAAAIPAICRAVATAKPVEAEAARIVDGFLGEAADAVIRRMLENDPFFGQVRRRISKKPDGESRWLSALLGRNRAIEGSAEDNAEMATQVHSWVGQLDELETPTPRLCFSLVEPEDDADPAGANWRVRFDLRSAETDEPLDITQVWTEPHNSPSILTRHLAGRRQRLMAELARAAEVFPELQAGLRKPGATGVDLTTSGAHTFLREWAQLLKARGFDVSLPDWATATNRQVGLKLMLKPEGSPEDAVDGVPSEVSVGSFGLNTLLDFDWRVAVGDETVSLEEFESIASHKAPLVKLRGSWVNMDWDAAELALKFIRSRPSGKVTLGDALRLAGGAVDLDTGLPIVGMTGSSWIEQLLAWAPDARIQEIVQPVGFTGTLRPYQLRGLEWLVFLDRLGIGACLADDMGLGKTIQLIALLLHEREQGPQPPQAPAAADQPTGKTAVGPTLLFAPMSVVGNWEREVRRFSPSLRVLVHHGPDRLMGDAFVDAALAHDLVITTYGLAQRDMKALTRVPWHRITLDEAQKIKNPSANQTIAIRALPSTHRVALTGTPVENHLSELWSIMEMLNPSLLGSASMFRERFAVPIEKMGDQHRAGQLRRMIRPFLLRRLKSDPEVECDLPEKMEMRVYCNLTPEQAAHYERLVSEMLNEVDAATGIRRRGLILATLTRLKQVCNHPEHLLRGEGPLDRRSGKCERLVEMLEELLEEGDAALIFTQYREMGHILERLLAERLHTELLFLHGGTPAKKRQEMIDQFQDPTSATRLFLLSLRAGGFGLNLTRANHVFHFDRWWNPAVEDQATDRAHRIGQTRRVQVHKFVCIGTIEDRIDQVLTEKSALADHIMGSGDEWLTSLSTKELREYLTLSSDAVAEE